MSESNPRSGDPFAFPPRLPHPKTMDKIRMLTEILSQNPADAFARYGLAMAYASENRQPEALAEFDRIVANTPDYVPAYQMSARSSSKQVGRTKPEPVCRPVCWPLPAPTTPMPPAKCRLCSTNWAPKDC